jgi:HlyD family secretion protein
LQREAPSNTLTLYGNVDIRQVELGFRVAGRLKSMAFDEGEQVRAGAVMAELDTRSFEDERIAAEAEVATQSATLKKLVAGSRQAEIQRARAAVDEAEASAKNAHTSLGRTTALVATGALAQANADDAVAATGMADARLAGAKEALRLLVQGTRVEDIEAARASLRLAQAHAATAQTSLDDARLIAPSEGVVISRVREPGAIVSPNDIVYVLSLTHSVWVRAYVSEAQLGMVRSGLQVSVVSDTAPSRPHTGRVGFISPTAEFTPKSVETPDLRTDLVYRLRIIVDDADSGLRQGMPVTVQIAAGGA